MATKSIRISESVHDKLKVHVAKKKKSIVSFADNAIMKEIKLDNAIRLSFKTSEQNPKQHT